MKELAETPSKASSHGASSSHPLTRKLAHFVPLTATDCQVLDNLTSEESRFNADRDIISADMTPR